MRYVIDVAYQGTDYSGWQIQPNAHTVQEEVNRVLSVLLKQPMSSMGAGRTDAGVHALKMPVHFDFEQELHPHFLKSMNALLPPAISVTRAYVPTTDNFNARFDAISRAYRYHLIFDKRPFWYNRAWWCKEKLDPEIMMRGAEIIKEYDSFESFCKARHSNKTYHCRIDRSELVWEDDMLVYHVKANRFLRGMVRTIMGTLYGLGKGALDLDGLRKVIEAKNRQQAGTSVVPDGLYLSEVNYPEGLLEEIPFKLK